MWQKFTERTRRVVFFAQDEAGKLGEKYVSTEHLLLGLVRENDCVGAQVLDRMGISLERIRQETMRLVARSDGQAGQDMELTPRAKRVIDLAYDEARMISNNYIGTEHILLGLVRERDGVAGQVLAKLGVELEAVRAQVILIQSERQGEEADAPRKFSSATIPSITTKSEIEQFLFQSDVLLNTLLTRLVAQEGEALFLLPNSHPLLLKEKQLKTLPSVMVTSTGLTQLLQSILTPEQREAMQRSELVTFAYDLREEAHFQGNVYRSSEGLCTVSFYRVSE